MEEEEGERSEEYGLMLYIKMDGDSTNNTSVLIFAC